MRWLNGVLTTLLILMIVVAGGVTWFMGQVDGKGPLGQETVVTIASGSGERTIADALEKKGIVSSRHIFLAHQLGYRIWTRMQGQKPTTLKAGDFRIKPGASVRDVAALIRSGKSDLIAVSVPEGLTSHAIVQRLLQQADLTGEIADIPPEGFLMPDTYRIRRNANRQDVLQLMAEEQRKFLRDAWSRRQPDLPYKDISEALILASMVEKETGPKDDPARIAGVFINRLRKGMRLQSDPTILYGKFGTQVAWGSTIYRSDIRKKTTHNTYQIDGLPPTPICNPGRASIEAALNPAKTNDLYFVANGQGGHIFSETIAQHNRAVAQWRQIEQQIRAREKEEAAKATASKPPVTVITAASTQGNAQVAQPASPQQAQKAPDGTPIPQRRPSKP